MARITGGPQKLALPPQLLKAKLQAPAPSLKHLVVPVGHSGASLFEPVTPPRDIGGTGHKTGASSSSQQPVTKWEPI